MYESRGSPVPVSPRKMSRRKVVDLTLSVLIFVAFVVTVGLFAAPHYGLIDLSSDPVVHAEENTTGVPEVEASNYPGVDGKELEMAIYEAVNEKRVEVGVEPLVHAERVRLIARLHSKDMAERGYFDHENPEEQGSLERHEQYGACESTNENIVRVGPLKTNGTERIVGVVIEEWSNSPGHNQSMLSSYDKVTGVGVYITENGTLYATQNFCREHPNA